MTKPHYVVTRFEEGNGALTRKQLEEVLSRIPLDIGVLTGMIYHLEQERRVQKNTKLLIY